MKNKAIQDMKQRVYDANISLPKEGLVKLTWGNVSEINRELDIIVIKPSGVPYDSLTPDKMVVTNSSGEPLEGGLRPSSDVLTHAFLFEHFPTINSVVHTHSTQAVCWAQAKRSIPVYGTTHADSFYGEIPCTRGLTENEVTTGYEYETGKVIVEVFEGKGIDPVACPGVIVSGHGPFTWGSTPGMAVQNSLILEEVAEMARGTEQLNPNISQIDPFLMDKHYYRKHGNQAYYGQES